MAVMLEWIDHPFSIRKTLGSITLSNRAKKSKLNCYLQICFLMFSIKRKESYENQAESPLDMLFNK